MNVPEPQDTAQGPVDSHATTTSSIRLKTDISVSSTFQSSNDCNPPSHALSTDKFPRAFTEATRCIQEAIQLQTKMCIEGHCLEQWVEEALRTYVWPVVREALAQYATSEEYFGLRSRLSTAINESRDVKPSSLPDCNPRADGKFVLPNDKTSQQWLQRIIGQMMQNIVEDMASQAVSQANLAIAQIEKKLACQNDALEQEKALHHQTKIQITKLKSYAAKMQQNSNASQLMSLDAESQLIELREQNEVLKRECESLKNTISMPKEGQKLPCPGCGREDVGIRSDLTVQQYSGQCVNERNFKVLYARIILRCGASDVVNVLRPFDEFHQQPTSYEWQPHEDPLHLIVVNKLKLRSFAASRWVLRMGTSLPMLYGQLDTYFRLRYPPPKTPIRMATKRDHRDAFG